MTPCVVMNETNAKRYFAETKLTKQKTFKDLGGRCPISGRRLYVSEMNRKVALWASVNKDIFSQ
jgi:hypothetical protein